MQPPGKTPGIMSLSPLPDQMEFSAQSGQFKLALKEWLAGTASRGFSIFSVFMGSKAEDLFCSLSGLTLYRSHAFSIWCSRNRPSLCMILTCLCKLLPVPTYCM